MDLVDEAVVLCVCVQCFCRRSWPFLVFPRQQLASLLGPAEEMRESGV